MGNRSRPRGKGANSGANSRGTVDSKKATKDRLLVKLAKKQGPKKICLTMIVKNESSNMVRLLDSVKPIIDMVSIVDTGSTDDTKQVIENWAKKNKMPCVVHEEPFINFAHNRTHSVTAAKAAFPDADYFLLSDADFVWDINKGGTFDKTLLIDHKYLVEQYNKSLSYWNIRLLSAKVNFECRGVTHEYWAEADSQESYVGEIRSGKISTLAIDDREDGGCKTDKFDRDERLLRGGLEDPDTPKGLATRYKFYLAQTLKDTRRFRESIHWYEERVADGGWAEEVFYAKFQIGWNYEQLGWNFKHAHKLSTQETKTEEEEKFLTSWPLVNCENYYDEYNFNFDKAAESYMSAYKYRRCRSESLYHLARMYRMLGRNEDSYNIVQIGKKIPYPQTDSLFIERACYDYSFDVELSIVCYYLPTKKEEGRKAVSKLLSRDDLPQSVIENAERNSRFYI